MPPRNDEKIKIMTIREIQELLRFADEKSGGVVGSGGIIDCRKDDICMRFCDVVREANTAGIDLTERFVNWLANKELNS